MKIGIKAAIGAAALLLLIGVASSNVYAGVKELKVDLASGYRTDELNWNISGFFDQNHPINVLSKLSWKNLKIFQVKTAGHMILEPTPLPFPVSLRLTFDYGWILKGKNQDSDFAAPNRTSEFSRSNNGADDGHVFDLSVGVGPRFVVPGDLKVTPLAGYSFHRQYLTLSDGFQTLSIPVDTPSGTVTPPPVGPIPGLDSRYRANWWGPWLGIELAYGFSKKLSFFGGARYHIVDYYADATWNLRSEGPFALAQPKSFEHDGNGHGLTLSLRGDYHLSDAWALSLQANYQVWKITNGTDRIFLANGDIGGSRLNEVNWRSLAVMLEATFRFF